MRKFMQEMMKARQGKSKLLTDRSTVEMMSKSGFDLELAGRSCMVHRFGRGS